MKAPKRTKGPRSVMKTVNMLTMVVVLCSARVTMARYLYTSDFESPTYTLGAVNGQDGWTATIPGGYHNDIKADSAGFPANGQWASMLAEPYKMCSMVRTINPDADILKTSWLWIPNDNGNPAAWGTAQFKLFDDAGVMYFNAWYRIDQPLHIVTDIAAVYVNTGFDPGEQAFIIEVEIDYALSKQRVSVTPVATGITQTSLWYNLAFGVTPTIADADGGTFSLETSFGGIDDLSIASVPPAGTLLIIE